MALCWALIPADMTSPIRILVADDEPAMLSLNANFLRQKGFDVTEASDGEAAWALAGLGGFDLLLLDVMMPGMSGWEVCKRVKQTAATKNTAVVMLTGMGETLNDMNSPLFSADAWLDKPFDFSELERKIRETLEAYGKGVADPFHEHLPKKAAKAAPKRAASKKAAPKKSPAKKPAPKKAAPKKAVLPKKADAKKAAPKKSSAKKTAPAAKKAAPKKAAAKQAVTKNAKPVKKAAPKKAAPKKAAAKRK